MSRDIVNWLYEKKVKVTYNLKQRENILSIVHVAFLSERVSTCVIVYKAREERIHETSMSNR
jgi:hypothetical protein